MIKEHIENKRYDFRTLEAKWRPYWEAIDLYKTGDDPGKSHYYILDFFPYPSGDGLSVGHCRNYIPTCVSARFMRMRGYNVLHPMGWDAFGLPAENYAIQHGIHPSESSRQFSATYRRQFKLIECSYDWSREFSSTDPDYYRWTQWFFRLLFERGLAYQAVGSQWWCPSCKTILANEQVENGRCWRCDSLVTRKEMKQWYFKITDYAERLLADLETINWPDSIKTAQRNWIGRSEGAEVTFVVEGGVENGRLGDSEKGDWRLGIESEDQRSSALVSVPSAEIVVFTTRPDTLYGVTFLVLAPEHPLVAEITTAEQRAAVESYVEEAKRMTEIDRAATNQEKNGVFTGAYAVHPLTGEPIPVWVADYVLMGYGTGAVMGVPANDARDYAFAQRYVLAVVPVIQAEEQRSGGAGEKGEISNLQSPIPNSPVVETRYGTLINSGPYTGMESAEAIPQIITDLETKGVGRPKVAYKMRDWLISRQRYWGAPIPIIHCPNCGAVAVPEEELPVLLPEAIDFRPTGDGRSPLANATEWVNTTCPTCGGPAQRETDTMDGFACSSWYFLRFASPHEADRPFDPEAVRRWLPVDLYVGGAEHAVMHLLYARFWTKVMYDAGLVEFTEPFTQLRNQGILHSAVDGQKMSKSKGNVVTPDEVVAEWGVDAARTYILFVGPFDASVVWDSRGIVGVSRFLERYWRLTQEIADFGMAISDSPTNLQSAIAMNTSPNPKLEHGRHKLIQRITREMEQFRFNTAVAAMMEHLNELVAMREARIGSVAQWRETIRDFTLLLAPIAPVITEEIWQTILGGTESVHRQPWPVYDEALTIDEQVTIVVQVDGKVRDRMTIAADSDQQTMRETAMQSAAVQRHVDGRVIENIIVVPGKLVNIVTGSLR